MLAIAPLYQYSMPTAASCFKRMSISTQYTKNLLPLRRADELSWMPSLVLRHHHRPLTKESYRYYGECCHILHGLLKYLSLIYLGNLVYAGSCQGTFQCSNLIGSNNLKIIGKTILTWVRICCFKSWFRWVWASVPHFIYDAT